MKLSRSSAARAAGDHTARGLGAAGVPRPASRRGFTLLEVLLSLVLATLVLGGAASVFWTAQRAHRHSLALAEREAAIDAAFRLLSEDLGQVLADHDPQRAPVQVIRLASGGEAPLLRLRAAAPIARPGPDRQVDYFVLPEAGRRQALVRRNEAAPPRTAAGLAVSPAADADADWEIVLPQVHTWRVRCFDGAAWRDSWPQAGAGAAPALMEITLEVPGRDTIDSYRRVLEIPVRGWAAQAGDRP